MVQIIEKLGIGSGKGLVLSRLQIIAWTNGD